MTASEREMFNQVRCGQEVIITLADGREVPVILTVWAPKERRVRGDIVAWRRPKMGAA